MNPSHSFKQSDTGAGGNPSPNIKDFTCTLSLSVFRTTHNPKIPPFPPTEAHQLFICFSFECLKRKNRDRVSSGTASALFGMTAAELTRQSIFKPHIWVKSLNHNVLKFWCRHPEFWSLFWVLFSYYWGKMEIQTVWLHRVRPKLPNNSGSLHFYSYHSLVM